MQLYTGSLTLPTYKAITYRRRKYSTLVITLDTETTSYLNSKGEERATLYEWQSCAGELNNTYYGRDYSTLLEYLEHLSKLLGDEVWQIVYIHNLGYDFEFLRNLGIDWEVFARTSHKPIYARNNKLRIELRDSYTYFHKSLEVLGHDLGLEVLKQEGYDYTKIRHSETPLTELELSYGEKDVQTLFLALTKELEIYRHICKLPYTQTGKVRRKVLKEVLMQKKYDVSHLVPDARMYLRLQKAFIGGYTHANFKYVGERLTDVDSDDYASSYPARMVAEKYPSGKWIKMTKMRKGYRHLLHVRLYNINTALDFPYLPSYSVIKSEGIEEDNGKVFSAKMVEYLMTDVDFSVVLQAYSIERYELIDIWGSYAKYLPKPFVEFILKLYGDKTALKGVEGAELEYGISKEYINSLYGMCVTNNVRDEVSLDEEGWNIKALTLDEVEEKLDKMRAGGRERLAYQWGVWVTAYARRDLFRPVLATKGNCIAYMDTDSVKTTFESATERESFRQIIANINKELVAKIDRALLSQGIDPELTRVKDAKGHVHQLGVFDFEGTYLEFKTWGAKKYAFCKLNKKGEVEQGITVSGLNKRKAIKDPKYTGVKDFELGRTWSEKYSGRTVSTYLEEQTPELLTDYLGNTIEVRDVYGINIASTTYTLGLSDEFSYFLGYEVLDENKTTERLSLNEID